MAEDWDNHGVGHPWCVDSKEAASPPLSVDKQGQPGTATCRFALEDLWIVTTWGHDDIFCDLF